jgi:hypothetical protein
MPLKRRKAFFFCLIKRSKNQVSKWASFRPGHAAQAGKTTGCIYAWPAALAPMPTPKRYAPATAHDHHYFSGFWPKLIC